MKLFSEAFEDGANLSPRYSCDEDGISPPLAWEDPPSGTKGLALICEDPDAPVGLFTHWLLYNIPPTTRALIEHLPTDETISEGMVQGKNSAGSIGFTGACPPPGQGEHRYIFKLYALDTDLFLSAGVEREQLLRAMSGHILEETQLTGKYMR